MTTDSLPEDIEAGIGWLTEGKTFQFEDVVFFLDRSSSNAVLNVDSYSSCIHFENIQESEAREKIDRSKKVGDYLLKSLVKLMKWRSRTSRRRPTALNT